MCLVRSLSPPPEPDIDPPSTMSATEDQDILERIAELKVGPDKPPVLVPFTSRDISLAKEFVEFRRNRNSWDKNRQEEWRLNQRPHVHELFEHWPALETPRLRLRLVLESDLEAAHRVLSDHAAMKYYGSQAHQSMDYTQKNFIEPMMMRFRLRDAIPLAITFKGDEKDEFQGHVTAVHIDRQFNFTEIAYIVDSRHWGKGIATEAVNCVVQFLINELKIHKIRASCFTDNIASRRVLDKAGFKEEGYLRQNCLLEDKYLDEYIMAIIATDVVCNGL
jgi:[ribosomal protein S5]-alanine N-acetyltransferase